MSAAVDTTDRILRCLIYDYLSKRGFREAASSLQDEANACGESVALDLPLIESQQSFLFEWFGLFWDVYSTKTSGDVDSAGASARNQENPLTTKHGNEEIRQDGIPNKFSEQQHQKGVELNSHRKADVSADQQNSRNVHKIQNSSASNQRINSTSSQPIQDQMKAMTASAEMQQARRISAGVDGFLESYNYGDQPAHRSSTSPGGAISGENPAKGNSGGRRVSPPSRPNESRQGPGAAGGGAAATAPGNGQKPAATGVEGVTEVSSSSAFSNGKKRGSSKTNVGRGGKSKRGGKSGQSLSSPQASLSLPPSGAVGAGSAQGEPNGSPGLGIGRPPAGGARPQWNGQQPFQFNVNENLHTQAQYSFSGFAMENASFGQDEQLKAWENVSREGMASVKFGSGQDVSAGLGTGHDLSVELGMRKPVRGGRGGRGGRGAGVSGGRGGGPGSVARDGKKGMSTKREPMASQQSPIPGLNLDIRNDHLLGSGRVGLPSGMEDAGDSDAFHREQIHGFDSGLRNGIHSDPTVALEEQQLLDILSGEQDDSPKLRSLNLDPDASLANIDRMLSGGFVFGNSSNNGLNSQIGRNNSDLQMFFNSSASEDVNDMLYGLGGGNRKN